MSEKIKVAIIGCGAIANSAHIPAYMKNEKAEIKNSRIICSPCRKK